jgi:hypothetical protein
MGKRREIRVGHGVDYGVHAGVGAGALVSRYSRSVRSR